MLSLVMGHSHAVLARAFADIEALALRRYRFSDQTSTKSSCVLNNFAIQNFLRMSLERCVLIYQLEV